MITSVSQRWNWPDELPWERLRAGYAIILLTLLTHTPATRHDLTREVSCRTDLAPKSIRSLFDNLRRYGLITTWGAARGHAFRLTTLGHQWLHDRQATP
jgi:DNA-binding PadR family transcriptional regulator